MKHSNLAFFIPHLGCPHQCSFCSQKTISGQEAAPSPQEVERVCREVLSGIGHPEETEIAFFGGSFTALPREQMTAYLEAAFPFVKRGLCKGIRVSTRPDGISGEILTLLRRYGVTAIELGAQSMDEEVLLENGRGHTAGQVREASRLVREFGFSLGLQMMTGLYGDSWEKSYETARELIALQPDTVRIYPTVVLKNTTLEKRYLAGNYHPPGVEESVPHCARLISMFEEAGIRVIRVGLHPSRELEEGLLAGAYHPAFRELCESRRYYEKMIELLRICPPGRYVLTVGQRELSKALGQKRANVNRLAERGYQVELKPQAGLLPYEIRFAGQERAERKEETGCC